MALPSFPLVLAASSSDGATLTAVAATSILHASGIPTIPAGALQVGSTIKAILRGRMNTVVTTPGTLTFDMRFGSVILSALGAINLNVAAQTAAAFELELLATIRSLGGAGVGLAFVTGKFTSRALVGSGTLAAGGNGIIMLPDTAPATGTGFDSTIAQQVNIFAAFSVASSLTVHQSLIELKV